MPITNLNQLIQPSEIASEIATDTEFQAAIASHAGANDPHPVYLTQAEGNAQYRRLYETQVFSEAAQAIGYSKGTFLTGSYVTGFEVRADNSQSAAYLSFHRPGLFACFLGLDTDNEIKIGGWSIGTPRKIWHEGNADIPLRKLVTGTLPTNAGGIIDIPLPTIITSSNIIGITGIVTLNIGNVIRNVPPLTLVAGVPTWYSIHAASGFPAGASPVSIRLTVGTTAESQSIFGAQVRALVDYS